MSKKKIAIEEIVESVMTDEIEEVIEEITNEIITEENVIEVEKVEVIEEAPVHAEASEEPAAADEVITIEEEPIAVEEEPAVVEEEIIEDDELKDISELKPKGLAVGDEVSIVRGAKFASGVKIPEYLYNNKFIIRQIKNDKCSIAPNAYGTITGVMYKKDLEPYSATPTPQFVSYYAIIQEDAVDIKSRPDENAKTLDTIRNHGLFTIVDEKNDWGHLKIGGWIPMSSYKRIN